MEKTQLRRAAAAGVAGTTTATFAGAILHTVAASVPFLPLAIAQILVRTTPGAFNSTFIDALGHWALRLAVLGVSIAFAASGLVLGPLFALLANRMGNRRQIAGAIVFLIPWVVSVVLYQAYPQSLARVPWAAVTFIVYVLCGIFAGRILERLERETSALATPSGPATATAANPLTRRTFIRSGIIGGAGIALGLANLSRLIYRRPDPGLRMLDFSQVKRAPVPSPAPGDAAFANIPGLTPEITSLADFYVVNEDIIQPDIDPATWKLSVGGLVSHPEQIPYSELRSMPAIERYQTMECISNKVGGHIMSTGKFVGVPLPQLLERAGGLQPGAVEVVFQSAGGYSDSVPVAQAMNPDTLIVIGMNNHVLPRAHGFPARVLGVGTYGMKNPKWLESIEAVDTPYTGFWEQRGWNRQAIIRTESRIDTPADGTTVQGEVVVAGVAIAGDRGISKVEVSADGGHTWNEAVMKTALSPLTWRLWMHRWRPGPSGSITLAVRAYDGTGAVQTPAGATPFPAGATGYDEITVEVA